MEINELLNAISNFIELQFIEAGQNDPKNIYNNIFHNLESRMLQDVMEGCRYNQCRAAEIVGWSRTKLRRKLFEYFGNKYVGSND